MSWDADAVRIELHQGMRVVWDEATRSTQMQVTETADIWLMGEKQTGDGRRHNPTVTTRKPVASLVADTRPELLRDLADWIEQEHDPGLRKIVQQVVDAKTATS